jgi:hypothetical protein
MSTSALPSPATPLGFGQIMDRIFRLMRANFWQLFKVSAPAMALQAALLLAIGGAVVLIFTPWDPPLQEQMVLRIVFIAAAALAYYLISLLVYALYLPAAFHAALAAEAGQPVDFRVSYAAAFAKAGRYIGLMLLFLLIVAGPVLLLMALAGGAIAMAALAAKASGNPAAMVAFIPLLPLLYILALVYSVLATLWLAVAYPASVAEDLPAWAAIRRSVRLTEGGRGRLFLVLLIVYAATYIATMLVECVIFAVGAIGFLLGLAMHLTMNPWGFVGIGLGVLLLLVAIYLLMTVIMSVYSVALTVFYRDQRLRKEGAAPVAAPAVNPAV